MKILVTGGAGYVGSVVAEELVKQGYEVLVLDNLQQGHREAVPKGAQLIQADICDLEAMKQVCQRHNIYAVMHMAGETVVEYSMTDPRRFFRNNVMGGLTLLEAMLKHNVCRIIFSSSAAVYGKPHITLIKESHSKVPVNSYGETKLMFERILEWYGKAYGLKHVSLRYFNAAGASEMLGEDHRPETHLIPNILKVALDKSSSVNIFGTDYPTKDGTCVRDYVHVVDIARAHVLALKKMDSISGKAYNLGNAGGYSVMEVVEAARRVTGVKIATKIGPRRPGDPAALVASSQLACDELGWKPEFPEIESIIETGWKWLKNHPNGYAC
ncbi:MAG: UDP-glucose 4-epimerase GalE [Chloroflexi bacterium]|nr:MAG: UDP-glucose 4-epimerase GalE [Chloroflexota bacterium]